MESNTQANGKTAAFAERFVALLDSAGARAASPVRVLDVGSGTARIPIDICRRRSHVFVTAVDRSASLLTRASHQIEAAHLAGRIGIAQADAAFLPYRDGEFDAVISNSVLHHLPDPVAALRGMLRVLKAGGLLFVRDTRPQSDINQIVSALARSTAVEESQRPISHRLAMPASLNIDQARQFAAAAGLPADWVEQAGLRHWTISGVTRESEPQGLSLRDQGEKRF